MTDLASTAQTTEEWDGFQEELGAAALWYAENGYSVLPLKPEGKTPLTSHGFKDATTDRGQIEKWWHRWPNANIGYALGPGRAILDVDSVEVLEALKYLDLDIPTTGTVKTGRIVTSHPSHPSAARQSGLLS